jgi:uncharacterized protein (DUF1800 family)
MGAQTQEPQVDPDRAWAPYEPDARRPWTLALAGHLYRRAAFDADLAQLQQALADGPRKTIDRLLKAPDDLAAFNQTYDGYEASAAGSDNADGLRAWWLRRMIQTPRPLLEKMTLFWHGHFAVNAKPVKAAMFIQRYAQCLRKHALGSFKTLLEEMCKDAAVLLSLDSAENRKSRPNAHFARALLECFTVGPDNCTEQDIVQAARAFTGGFVRRGAFQYIAREHDDAPKRVLGQEGNFTGDDVVRIVLDHPAAAQTIVRKLYHRLISETSEPNAALIDPLAKAFAADYDIAKLVETMLRSNIFFSSVAYRGRIKSPVEFALGIVKGLEGMVSTTQLADDLAAIGQNLYYPPTVKGWPGGRHWINDATLIARSNLAAAMLKGADPYGKKLDPWTIAGKYGNTTVDSAAQFVIDLFLQNDLPAETRNAIMKTATDKGDPAALLRQIAYAAVTLPEFHLA